MFYASHVWFFLFFCFVFISYRLELDYTFTFRIFYYMLTGSSDISSSSELSSSASFCSRGSSGIDGVRLFRLVDGFQSAVSVCPFCGNLSAVVLGKSDSVWFCF